MCFGVIYLSLSRRAIPRISSIFSERSKRIEGQLKEADSLKAEATKILQDIEIQLKHAHKEANEIISVALHEVNLLSTQRKNEFTDIMKRQLTASEKKIGRKKQAAYEEVKGTALNTALAIIEALAPIKIQTDNAEEIVNRLITESRKVPNSKEVIISNAS